MNSWVVRDNIYGNIIVQDQVIVDLINCQEFQRLRRILQLAGAQFAFPGATHTRFSHCIGVYHLISKFLMQTAFKSLTDEEKLLTKIAGLLHDLGHGPFSHSFELISSKKHEDWTIEIIKSEKTEINQVLRKHNLDIEQICKIIAKTHHNQVLLSLVSSQIDCDRMDYLLRDSFHTGVEYGRIDLEWIIQNVAIKGTEIVFNIKSVFAIENFLLARYHMYSQVYNHKVGKAFDCLLQYLFKRLKFLFANNFSFKSDVTLISDLCLNEDINLKAYLALDDYQLMSIIKSLVEEDDRILHDLAKRLVNRNFFKFILLSEINSLENVQKKIVAQGYDLDYYLYIGKNDAPIIYELSNKETIKIIDNNANLIDLKRISKIVNIKLNEEYKEYLLIPKEIDEK